MAVLATDNFNRANTTGPDMGANWTNVSVHFGANGCQIVSNHCEPTDLVSTDKCEFYSGIAWPDDQYAQCKVTITGTGMESGFGPALRCNANGSAYRAVVNNRPGNNVTVDKHVAGVYTSLGQRTVTWVAGDTLRLEVQGSTLRVYQNGVQLGPGMTDTSLTTGPPGINFSAHVLLTAAQLDDWEGGSLDLISPPAYWIRA